MKLHEWQESMYSSPAIKKLRRDKREKDKAYRAACRQRKEQVLARVKTEGQ